MYEVFFSIKLDNPIYMYTIDYRNDITYDMISGCVILEIMEDEKMKAIKKALRIVLALVTILTFSACGENKNETVEKEKNGYTISE